MACVQPEPPDALPFEPAYAELEVTSNFTFLNSGSHPEELVARAARLGYRAVAMADHNTLAGIVRAHIAAKQANIRLLVGCRLVFRDGPDTLCFPQDRQAYGRLCRLLTLGRRRAPKGECWLDLADLRARAAEWGQGQIFVVIPPDLPAAQLSDGAAGEVFRKTLSHLAARFPGNCYLAAHCLYRGDDRRRLAALNALAARTGAALVAVNDVRLHDPARRRLLDVVSCIRDRVTIDRAGLRLGAHAERHLKPPAEMARLFAEFPDAIRRTMEIADRLDFSLDGLRYDYPVDPVPAGRTPQEELVHLVGKGTAERYPECVPEKVERQISHELALIEELGYAPYFLTVHDIVRFARDRGILCQGRGSAANSAVCFCLGITSVDPNRIDLLFERFVSTERNEPPDIDVDFEHERREEVIQYIYAKYGRDRAALAATVITYRTRSALRDVGRALGLSLDVVGALAGTVWGTSSRGLDTARVRDLGLDPEDPRLALTLELSRELIGFPRHLSQHVGGFVIASGALADMVPVENARMADRTLIQWDKDDLDALGMLKIDVLGLGMLSCIRRAFGLLRWHGGLDHDLATVPAEDPAVYEMLSRGDSLGVFQVESRAQMTMLPRLKPRNFYDLVIEVAIVRPGPIQGDMVHPYLRRRHGEESVTYPSEELRRVLGKTLGVPLFQEQAMKIAIVAAGFTPAEADRLRRAMATFKRTGQVAGFRDKMIRGMIARGYERDFAERCFNQIEGFGEYGFPESHAASFALLVYVSAWLKCHHPAHFACALLNSQPMGFYAPAQIVRDARSHGVEIRPVDVNHSEWDCTLEWIGPAPWDAALRLGFRQVRGMHEEEARALVAARAARPEGRFRSIREIWSRAGTRPATLARLAEADTMASLEMDRRQALWAVRGLGPRPLPLFRAAEARGAAEAGDGAGSSEPAVTLPALTQGENVVSDYRSLGLSLRPHPVALLRARLPGGTIPAARLADVPNNSRVEVAGLVFVRQRPGTAKGVIFMTIEDETGVANLIVWPGTMEKFRRVVIGAAMVRAVGRVQREGLVIHVIVERLEDMTPLLATVSRMGAAKADDMTDEAIRLRSHDFY